jgi:autotransporter-associated beta strand protein
LVAVSTIDAALGDVDVKEGSFAIQTSTTQFGNPAAAIRVFSGATLNVYRLTNTPLNKVLVFSNAATMFSENDSNILRGPVSFYGNVTNNVNSAGLNPSLTFANVIGGPGGVTKIGAATLIFTTNNTYAGDTFINTGTLALRGNGSISNAATITIASGATLDVTARTDGLLNLAATQAVAGAGTVSGTLFATNLGAIVSPGGDVLGKLTVTGNATLRGLTRIDLSKATATNDVLQVGGSLAYGGTLALTNLGGALAAGDGFKVFNAAAYAATFNGFLPPTPSPGLIWDTNLLAVSGTLRIAVAPPPIITSATLSGMNVVLAGTNGPPNGTYWILASTNVALPLTSWPVIGTNTFNATGGFTLTNAVDPAAPQLFYVLQLQ